MKTHLLTATMVMAVVVSFQNIWAQCGPTGAKAPTNAVNDNSFPVGLIPFINTGNTDASDDSYADVTALVLGDTSQYLLSNDYEFSIPTNATICGIEVTVERSAAGVLQAVTDFSVRLAKGGTISGDDKKDASVWPTTDQTITYGGPTDLWGLTWTPADINDSAFGFAHAVDLSGVSVLPTARFDNVSMNIYYSTPLPITLMYFSGTRMGDMLDFKWSTASEINNSYFDIEMRQTDGAWMSISSIPGAGNSTERIDYSVQLRSSSDQATYFRLKQVDDDGQFSYSDIILIQGKDFAPSKTFAKLHGDQLIVTSNKALNSIQLYTLDGKLKLKKELPTTQTTVNISIPSGKLTTAVYYLRTVDELGRQEVLRVHL